MSCCLEDSLKKRYLIKLFSNIINGLINIVVVAIVPTALGPVAYGQFTYIQQFFSQLISFFDAGTSTAFFTKLAKNVKRLELMKFYFLYAFFLLIFISSTVLLIDHFGYDPYFFPDVSSRYIYMGIFFGFFVWFTTIFIYIADAFVLTISVETIKIIHKIFSLLLLLWFIHYLNFDLVSYFYYHYISLLFFILVVSYLFFAKKIFSKDLWKVPLEVKKLSKEFSLFSSPLLVFNTFGIIFGIFDFWLLQKVSGSVQTGFYGLAYSIAAMCFLFTSAMTPIITREFAKSYEKKDFESIRKNFSRYIPMLYAIATYFSVFISFESENLIHIFTDEKFQDAYLVLVIMAYYPIHQTYGQLSGSLFYVTEQTKLVRNIGLFSIFIGFILTLFLIYFLNLGAIGLAWKMVLVQIISVNIQLYFNSKFLKISIFPLLFHQIYSILFFLFMIFLTNLIMISLENKLAEFLISGLIYTLFVIIGTLIIPGVFSVSREEVSRFKNKLLKRS